MAEQEFDNLLKNISQINAQLEITGKLVNDLGLKLQANNVSPLANLVKNMESDIRKLSELKNQLNASALREASQGRQGLGRGAPYGRVPGEQTYSPYEDKRTLLESRNVSGNRDAEVRKIGRDIALRTINQIQKQLLEGAIESRANAQQNDLLSYAIKNRPASSGLQSAVDRATAAPAPRGRATSSNVFPELYGQNQPGVTVIHHPTEQVGLDLENAEKAYAQYLKSQLNLVDPAKKRASVVNPEDVIRNDYEKNRKPAVGDDNLTKALSAREIAELEASEAAKRTIQAEVKYQRALEIAAQQGYSPDDLKRLRTRGTGGIEQLQFQRTDEYGKQRNLDLFVNQAGKATPGISNQFRTFGQGIVRDIGELTKWSIALAAVYGPMKKVQELTQIMIDNQTRLAEATISVNSSLIGQAEIFDTAARAAESAGEAISGVIDAFTQAYRATGGTGDEVERFASANKLLADSLTLSKLSTLDQASAIDTLSAALRQTYGTDLTKGTELLDKWVRVTKVANVDLAGLATGFAVLGDSADAAGIGIDELNGLIAAIAETGVASGRELANTARAIVAGFQSDQARKALEGIGVAFESSTGQARPFLEVMQELANLRQTGALDNTAFSKLTLALGGGSRRAASFATLIENFGRVGEVANESSKASGDAAASLAKQLETVQTSLTKLSNAFEVLAQTLGTEGGFLGIITEGVDTMTSLVKVFDSLTSVLGKATPALAAFIATSLILKSRGQGGISQAITGFANKNLFESESSVLDRRMLGLGLPEGQGTKNFIGKNILGTNASSGAAQGLLASIIPAYLNATNKQDKYGGEKAGADILGGVAGGILGSLAGPQGIIIGATIGTAVAEAFINSTVAHEGDLFAYNKPTSLGGAGQTQRSEDADKRLENAVSGIYKSIGGGNEAIGKIVAAPEEKIARNLIDNINEAIKLQDPAKLNRVLGAANVTSPSTLANLSKAGITSEFIKNAFAGNQQIQFSPENLSYGRASKAAQGEYNAALAYRTAQGGTPENVETPFSKAIEQNKSTFTDLIASLRENSRSQLLRERSAGDLKGAEYGRRTEALSGFDTKALNYYTALGGKVTQLGGGADTAAEQFKVLNRIITSGADEAIPQITAINGEIENLINLISNPSTSAEDFKPFGGIEGAKKQLEDLRQTEVNLINDVNQQALVSQVKIPSISGNINKPYTSPEEGLIEQRTKQLQDPFYKQLPGVTEDIYKALKEGMDVFQVAIKDSGDEFYKSVTETDQQFRQAAIQQLEEEGKLRSQQQNPFDIQKLDINSQQGAGLQGSIDYYSKYLKQNFPQYEQKPEQFGVIFNDYVTSVLHGDNLAVKLALEKLVDINQKQLDGQYNIPEGATFWVPLTAAYYKPKNEGTGMPTVDSLAVDGNTSATDQNTVALQQLTARYQSDNHIEREYGREGASSRNGHGEDRLRFRGEAGRTNSLGGLLASQATLDRKSEDMGSSPAPKASAPPPGFWETLLNGLKTFFHPDGNSQYRPGGLSGGDAAGGYKGINTQSSAQQVNPQVNARLQIQMENTTQLVVDGRVLASVISPFLSQEMVRLESSQGTITKRYVI